MKSFKLLLLTHRFFPDIGGTETNALFLAKAMHEAGANVTVITWTQEVDKRLFPFKVIRHPGFFTLLRHHFKADLVFENHLCLRLSWPRFFTGRPGVVVLNTWVQTAGKGFGTWLRRSWLRRSKVVIAVSTALKKKVWPAAIVIENAYDDKLFRRDNVMQKTKPFLFLGRLVSDKGVDLIVEAFHLIANQENALRTKYQITVVGDGPDRQKLEKKVGEYAIEDMFEFTGIKKDEELVCILNKHQFIIVPSAWEEPYGIVALEGMACGCIPIVASSGGLPEAVGEGGLIFAKGDAIDLAAKIRTITNNTDLQQNLASAAEVKLLKNTRNAVAQQYLSVFKCILNVE
jgi:glycosyltransferase involved in cell wall biosynthesis